MSGYPGIRASDEDRSRIAAALGEHYAAWLTLEEFQERLEKVYGAKTLGELDRLMATCQEPISAGFRSGALRVRCRSRWVVALAWRTAWRFWLAISAFAFVIWLLGGAGAPWFLWVAVPLGLVMLRRWSAAGHRHDGRG